MNGEQLLAAVGTTLINVALLVGMALAGIVRAEAAPEEPQYVPFDIVELPKLGKEPEKNALPRIVKPPPPPPPDSDVASLSREKEEQALEEAKKKREQEEEKRRLDEEEKERRKQARKEKRDRKKAMDRALSNLDDPRADEDTPDGLKDGLKDGTTTDPNYAKNRNAYISLVSTILQRQFQVPATIPEDERKRLKASVFFKLDETGKVVGSPRIAKSSRNAQFDGAVLATARKFGPGTQFKILLPPAAQRELRRTVLKKGITAIMWGKKR